MQQLTVPPDAAGQRLDQFLAGALRRSRGDIQRKIARHEVLVGGQPLERDARVVSGQQFDLLDDASETPAAAAAPHPAVIAEDDDLLVLNKPSGLTMHPADGVREQTLVDWLLARSPALRGVGDDPQRPGIVHRLDREASGLVVAAKTQAAFEHLKRAFQERRVEKHYRALVHGIVEPNAHTITFPIERAADGRMVAKPVGSDGRAAETHFTVLERMPPFTLLDVVTKTGRTHQVRVHLNAYGHPIAGDPLYFQKRFRNVRRPPRLFLHAASLRFPHLDGTERTYEAPLPPDLKNFLDSLQQRVT
ncbi:MAG: RluA family pseudouridine synthase [Candidatus Kerfeldbacteria bacterium]|nr:RluA family pseudouridine synthase [Candidatus Kerfeldbacteria bacterium]